MSVLNKVEESFLEQKEIIIKRIDQEEDVVKGKIRDIQSLWEQKQPQSGKNSPQEALQVLEIIQKRIQDAKNQTQQINQAKQMLGLKAFQVPEIKSFEEDTRMLLELWQTLKLAYE